MYAVEIRGHVMIAHSLPHPGFGPAQGLHGATYVVDVAFFRKALGEMAVVVDMGRAGDFLAEVLSAINYRNLDDLPAFAGTISTTETVAKWIFDRFAGAIARGDLGEDGKAIARLRVTLHESHIARAWYEADVPAQ
jgi:6-pyruvoyl-tetrahydropterin synthase